MNISLGTIGTSQVTTCTYENSFSAMRLLKRCARSNMVLEVLNKIVVMHVHQEVDLDIKKVIDL